MNSKIALGTAQFGLDYGINNTRGKIPKQEVFDILRYALKKKIGLLDTAYDYGEAEGVIGQFIKDRKFPFKIISKLPRCDSKLTESLFRKSLKRLNQDRIYGYLIHNFKFFLKNGAIWEALERLKGEGKIKKIGFSLYYPSELEYLLRKKMHFNIIQIPYSFFDQRFKDYFPLLKKRKIEIHARSIFLQGLIFKDPDKLEKKFLKLKDRLVFLRALSKENDIPISAAAINFAFLNKGIDKIIIGVESFKNLQENIRGLRYKKIIKKLYSSLVSLKENDEGIILPINWQ